MVPVVFGPIWAFWRISSLNQLRSWFIIWPNKPNEKLNKWNISLCVSGPTLNEADNYPNEKKITRLFAKQMLEEGMQTDLHLSILSVAGIEPESLETLPTCVRFTQYMQFVPVSANCITKPVSWSNHRSACRQTAALKLVRTSEREGVNQGTGIWIELLVFG